MKKTKRAERDQDVEEHRVGEKGSVGTVYREEIRRQITGSRGQ